jgi:dCMP deaminase
MKHLDLYKDVVKLLANASKDKRLKVGAILLKDGRIVATGYNGQIRGQPHDPIMQDGHDISTVHSEMNIIAFCSKQGISTNDCMMLTTHSPCQICTKLMIQAGIKKVYYIEPYRIDENPFLKLIEHEQVEDGKTI